MNTAGNYEISATGPSYDLICFSHLRWDFVFQRPQHLMTRASKKRRIFIIEEPVFTDGLEPALNVTERQENLFVVVPQLPAGSDEERTTVLLRRLFDDLYNSKNINNCVHWYYTPMMLAWSRHLTPLVTVYDCMDELSAFKNAPRELREREAELFAKADLVFTGGQSLYEVKKDQHPNVYAFPSSIDVDHFSQALSITEDMPDQEKIPFPRIGFVGVIDERLDIPLLAEIADLRPEIQFVMIGPVVKIDPNDLPRRTNIHYLGGKQYSELPEYLALWQVAMMPFAMNESTRFISPTKTPEYLAAGLPVVSTPIHDVVTPYGEKSLVHIARTAGEFVAAIDAALECDLMEHRARSSDHLSDISWNKTFEVMSGLIDDAILDRKQNQARAVEIGGYLA